MSEQHDPDTGEVFDGVVEHGAFWRSGDLAALFAAKAKAQAKITNATKDASNPHFGSKYATLAAATDACLGPLAEQGISVWQFPSNGQGETIGVTTLLGHSSGQWIESTLFVRPAKFDAQGVGSAITYLRRYALMAIAGVAPEDDDGNAAVSGPGPAAPPPQRRAGRPTAAVQPPRYEEARAALLACQADVDGAETIDHLLHVTEGMGSLQALMKEGSPDTWEAAMERLHERVAKREKALRGLAP